MGSDSIFNKRSYKLFQNIEKKQTAPNFFSEAWYPNQTEILNKTLSNKIQQYSKKTIYHDKWLDSSKDSKMVQIAIQ